MLLRFVAYAGKWDHSKILFSFTHGYGFCERCRSHTFPADVSLGLLSGGRASPQPPAPAGGTLIIEMDAWNIRERDYWGKTQRRREDEEETGRWHWVYTGTGF